MVSVSWKVVKDKWLVASGWKRWNLSVGKSLVIGNKWLVVIGKLGTSHVCHLASAHSGYGNNG